MTAVNDIFHLIGGMLAIFTAALIFVFVASILMITTYLAIMIGKQLYETYIKYIFRGVRECIKN